MVRLEAIRDAGGLAACKVYMEQSARFPAQFFLPNRPQADLIRAVGELTPDKRIYLVTSANGIGKTTAAINILLNIIYPGLNAWPYARDCETGEVWPNGFFDFPLYRQFPLSWPRNVWYISNNDAIRSIERKFREWTNPRDVQFPRDGRTHASRVLFPSRPSWEISFKTIDQDPQTFESADISIVIFDEPPPYRLYNAAVGRLRSGGIIIIPATPLFTAAWFVDEIINRVGVDGDKYHQTVNIWTNCIEDAGSWDLGPIWGVHPKGNLYKRNIMFLLDNWDKDEIEARRDGSFKYLTGLIFKSYPEYDHNLEMRTQILSSPRMYTYRMIIDPHERRPPAIIWEVVLSEYRRHILREWPSIADQEYDHLPYHKIKDAGRYTVKDFVRIIDRIERELNIPKDNIRRIMDPNMGRKRQGTTGTTVAEDYSAAAREILNEEWAFNLNANDDLNAGHSKIREALKADPHGHPYLTHEPDCHNVVYAFTHYSWDDLTAAMAEKKEISIKPKEIGKDFIDVIRYSMMIALSPAELKQDHRDPYEDADYGEAVDWRTKIQYVKRPEGAHGA